MAAYRSRRGGAPAEACCRRGRERLRLCKLKGRAARGGLFGRAEMDNHLWTEALRGRCVGRLDASAAALGMAAVRPEVSEGVMRGGSRCLRLGRCMRLVNGPLAGCVGVLLPQRGRGLSLHIFRHPPAWEGAEYVEPVH